MPVLVDRGQVVVVRHAGRIATWTGSTRAAVVAIALVLVALPARAHADEPPPTKWEQLFFPFPIIGAPPQLEQQVQVFNEYFRGDHGSATVPSAELAYIVSPHLGLVLDIPVQIGIDNQTTGLEDLNLLVQYLATGSLDHDAMVSLGVSATFPTGRGDLSEGDYLVGPFAYGAKRWFDHLVVEGNVTGLLSVVHGASTRQLLANGMVAVMVTPRRFDYPIYAQVEVDSTTTTRTGALFVAPEVFVGPFESPIDKGTRLAAGVSFELAGDPVHRQTYMVTIAFDIPNKYGY